MLVLGKSISGGIPLGAYGMSARVVAVRDTPEAGWGEGVATGGTLFGNALSLAAARVTSEQVLTEDAYDHAATLGGKLADGIETTAQPMVSTGVRTACSTAAATRMRRISPPTRRKPATVSTSSSTTSSESIWRTVASGTPSIRQAQLPESRPRPSTSTAISRCSTNFFGSCGNRQAAARSASV